MKRLGKLLGIPAYGPVGIFERLCHFTAEYSPAGDVGKFSDEDIADACGWDRNPAELIDALVGASLIETEESRTSAGLFVRHGSRLLVHDWSEHADDSVNNKLARRGEWFADGKRPNTKRLESKERAKCEVELDANNPHTQAHGVHTACTRQAHGVRVPCEGPAPPRHGLAQPSPALPPPSPPKVPTAVARPDGQADQSGGGSGGDAWENSRELANAIARRLKVPPPVKGKYRRMVIQAAYLSITELGEDWLQDAIEDTGRKKRNDTWAYLRTCLATGCEARGRNLDAMLIELVVPARFLTAQVRPPTIDVVREESEPEIDESSDNIRSLAGAMKEAVRRPAGEPAA
jgi:hypothetical protein